MFSTDSCLFVSDLGVGACAAWVQTIGSLIALCIAVAVPYFQHRHAVKAANKSVVDSALIAASSSLLRMNPLLGALETIARQLEKNDSEEPRRLVEVLSVIFDNINLPSEDQVLKIAAANRSLALKISRGRDLFLQAKLATDLLRLGSHGDEALIRMLGPVRTGVVAAKAMFGEAKTQLSSFVEAAERDTDQLKH